MLKTSTNICQQTTTPSGERSRQCGQQSCTLTPLCASGGERTADTETNNIKELCEEFKDLYEQRFRCVQLDSGGSGQDLLQKKVNFLQSYVKDLEDQNNVLVQTIEDLQQEADHKVSDVGMELQTSGCILDVSEEDLRTMHLDELVGSAAHIPHGPGSLEDLKIPLETKDVMLSDLERNQRDSFQQKRKTASQVSERSERLVHLQSELSCLQRIHKDSTKEIAEKDICITKLRASIELLQQEGSDSHAQLSKLSVRARELQEEWSQKEDELRLKHDKKLQRAEERRRQEQQKREKKEDEWKRAIEEERKAHAQAVRTWAEQTASLNAELKVSRKQGERQHRELSQLHQKEETLLSEAEVKMASLRAERSTAFERRMEEKEERINQLNEELNGVRRTMKERVEHVRDLDQDVVCLRATQDSLKRTLAMKEKHTNQLVGDNAELKEGLASLQSKSQAGERMLRDISDTLDQTKTGLQTERQQKQQIQDQLHHANREMECLQQELKHVRFTTEKKSHKKDNKICALVKALTESERLHSECQKELLRREKASEKLCEERDELRAKMDDRSRECVHLNQAQERLEADLALSHEKLHTLHLEVRSRDQLILQLRAEMKSAEQKYQSTQEQVAALEGEVRRLKCKVRGHQDEACKLNQKVRDIERLKAQTEKDQQQLQDQLCTSEQQVQTFEGKLKKQEAEMELLQQQLKGAEEALKDAGSQKETVSVFKQKYTAAIEKVHRVQGRVELLEEELRYSQQQLTDSRSATHSVKQELAEMMQRHQEKVGQWEYSQEALDQLTDELQVNQNLLRESRQEVDHLRGLIGSVQEQVDTLKQQKKVLDSDRRLYQQLHSHSDKEYLRLLQDRQQLQQRCALQVERHAECEKAILQMKSELERQAQEKAALKQSLVASNHTHMSDRARLEQEVLCLKKEVTCLEVELEDNQKVHAALLCQSEEELKEAERQAARRSSELDVQREELEEMRSAVREKQRLSFQSRQSRRELEELRRTHQVTVEELAARAEEARRMEGCLTEGKLAEEKIRSMAARLELEAAELKRNLQHAVDQKLEAEREKQDAQEQVDTFRSELERTRADNTNLRHESQQVMTNVNHWITDQKASNSSLTAEMKAQNKLLLIITEEKERLQEANDTLNAEVKRLKEVSNEKERDMELFKARIRDQGARRDDNVLEKQGCVARNLYKIEDMQTRLRGNLEAIGMLNQQLNALSKENKRLRRQLEEERSMRRQADKQSSSIRLPLSLSAHPPPPSASLPSSLRRPPPLSSDTVTGDVLTQAELSGAGPERPGESQALGKGFWKKADWPPGKKKKHSRLGEQAET
ncbi:trichohyalin-like [Labrus bergylta]|uniref:trichohyalin-like n=1 Tax=Labrus bergylta TaxID=56723 RepID=UPI003313B024